MQTRQTKVYALNIREQHFAHAMRVDVFKSRYIPGHRPQIFTFYPRCLPNPKPQLLNYRSGLYKTPTTSLSSSALHETTPNYFSVPKHNPFDE